MITEKVSVSFNVFLLVQQKHLSSLSKIDTSIEVFR